MNDEPSAPQSGPDLPDANLPRPSDRPRERQRAAVKSDAIYLESLLTLSAADLRSLWLKHMGRAAPPTQKRLLIRELAWRAQERTYGGLDAETRRLLNRAVRAASKNGTPDNDRDGAEAAMTKRRPRGEASTIRAAGCDLPPATKLARTWRGVRYEVYVLNGGREFRYRDQAYGSLSEIAREITGTRWSGPRFFGLTTREDAKSPASGRRRRKGGDPS